MFTSPPPPNPSFPSQPPPCHSLVLYRSLPSPLTLRPRKVAVGSAPADPCFTSANPCLERVESHCEDVSSSIDLRRSCFCRYRLPRSLNRGRYVERDGVRLVVPFLTALTLTLVVEESFTGVSKHGQVRRSQYLRIKLELGTLAQLVHVSVRG